MILTYDGKLVKIVYMYRVEVANNMEAEKVREVANAHDAAYKKGKPHGKPGEYRVDCYVEADPFGSRDKLFDMIRRRVPGAHVYYGGDMEIETL